MKKLMIAGLLGTLTLAASCKDFLDVNRNPAAPETVAANLYLAPMLHWMVSSPQWDGRFVGRYTQMWVVQGTSPSNWDRMGYDAGSDNGAQHWRDVYWSLGQNLVDMMEKSRAEQRWDLLGIGYALKGWGWLALTDLHGEIPIKEAFNPGQYRFDYDSQEYAYQTVIAYLDSAIVSLQRTDGLIQPSYVGRFDKIYNGDRAKWLKYAYGLKAITLNHFSNKTTYAPARVVALVDSSFASNADDALLRFPATVNDDRNFFGPTRANLCCVTIYKQSQFIVNLMNGTQFGGAVDPRMSRMLAPAPDGLYRGLDPAVGSTTGLGTSQIPMTVWGYVSNPGIDAFTRYIFDDKSRFPAMTYSMLQFVKAEAAYRMGDKNTALTAYRNAISSHVDFVNARNLDNGQLATQITAAEKAAFLADPNIVPTSATLTLTHIMAQKYIALWAWGFNEVWMDLRRYQYTGTDPATGRQVFPGFVPPGTTLFADNAGKLVQRLRPRYNSEYVWNMPIMIKLGADKADYHTVPLWITQP